VATTISDRQDWPRSSRAARGYLLVDAPPRHARPGRAPRWRLSMAGMATGENGQYVSARMHILRPGAKGTASTAETLLLSDITAAYGRHHPAVRTLVAIDNAGRSIDLRPATPSGQEGHRHGSRGPPRDSLNDKEWMGGLNEGHSPNGGRRPPALRLLDTHRGGDGRDGRERTRRFKGLRSSPRRARYDAVGRDTRTARSSGKPRPVAKRADRALGLARAYRCSIFSRPRTERSCWRPPWTARHLREAARVEAGRESGRIRSHPGIGPGALGARRIKTSPTPPQRACTEAIKWISGGFPGRGGFAGGRGKESRRRGRKGEQGRRGKGGLKDERRRTREREEETERRPERAPTEQEEQKGALVAGTAEREIEVGESP